MALNPSLRLPHFMTSQRRGADSNDRVFDVLLALDESQLHHGGRQPVSLRLVLRMLQSSAQNGLHRRDHLFAGQLREEKYTLINSLRINTRKVPLGHSDVDSTKREAKQQINLQFR